MTQKYFTSAAARRPASQMLLGVHSPRRRQVNSAAHQLHPHHLKISPAAPFPFTNNNTNTQNSIPEQHLQRHHGLHARLRNRRIPTAAGRLRPGGCRFRNIGRFQNQVYRPVRAGNGGTSSRKCYGRCYNDPSGLGPRVLLSSPCIPFA